MCAREKSEPSGFVRAEETQHFEGAESSSVRAHVTDAHIRALEMLRDRGFMKFVPKDEWDLVTSEVLATMTRGSLEGRVDKYLTSSTRRIYHADSEDLAEMGLSPVLKRMRDVFDHEGLKLHSVEDSIRRDAEGVPTEYGILINGEYFTLFDLPRSDEQAMCEEALLDICNLLLARVGSEERAFGLMSGNDFSVILLTPELRDSVMTLPFLSADAKPWSVRQT